MSSIFDANDNSRIMPFRYKDGAYGFYCDQGATVRSYDMTTIEAAEFFYSVYGDAGNPLGIVRINYFLYVTASADEKKRVIRRISKSVTSNRGFFDDLLFEIWRRDGIDARTLYAGIFEIECPEESRLVAEILESRETILSENGLYTSEASLVYGDWLEERARTADAMIARAQIAWMVRRNAWNTSHLCFPVFIDVKNYKFTLWVPVCGNPGSVVPTSIETRRREVARVKNRRCIACWAAKNSGSIEEKIKKAREKSIRANTPSRRVGFSL